MIKAVFGKKAKPYSEILNFMLVPPCKFGQLYEKFEDETHTGRCYVVLMVNFIPNWYYYRRKRLFFSTQYGSKPLIAGARVSAITV